jgi:hypothetical protein
MAEQEIKVKINGDTSGLEKSLASVQKSLKVFAAAAGAAIGGATVAMVALTKQGLAFVDSQAKAARSMDGTINGLRALTLAGNEAGISTDEMVTSMQTMQRTLAQAASEGGAAADMLKSIGLSASDLSAMDVDKRLATIADRAKQLGMDAGQTSRMLQVLGVRSRTLGVLVSGGGDAVREAAGAVRDFGLSIDEGMARKVEAANDAMERMRLVFEGLRVQLAVSVAPALQRVAERFQELSKVGGPLQEAITRVSAAWGALAEVVLSEDFINTAAAALTGLANALAFVAENAHWLGPILAALAGAMVAMSGPMGAVTIAGGALVAIWAAWRRDGPGTVDAVSSVTRAEMALNDALWEFARNDVPNANAASGDRVKQLKQQAEQALATAEAELKVLEVQHETMLARKAAAEAFAPGSGAGIFGAMDQFLSTEQIAEAAERVAALRVAIENVRSDMAMIAANRPGPLKAQIFNETRDTPPGLPEVDVLRSQLEARLAVLTEGLMNEQEVVAAWYESGRETLNQALSAELLTRQEYAAQMERLEEEHQKRLAAIKEAGADWGLQAVLSGSAEILGAMGDMNKKALKISKVFAAAEAFVSTMQGAAAALKQGVFGFAQAAAVIAKGMGFVAAIKGVNESTGATGGGGGGGSSAGMSQQQAPTQTLNFTLTNDPFGFGGNIIRQLAEQLNQASRNGTNLRARVT